MTIDFEAVDAIIEKNFDQTVAELRRLVGQPSVSAQNRGITECANLVAEMLSERGYATQIMFTDGYPVVYGEADGTNNERTMLLYLHYDVQPPEPLALWLSPPWELTERKGALYGRGVSDDKGHIITRLAALDALVEATGELPCRVKFVIEGEEEIGSPSIRPFITDNKELLAADACIWEFGGVNMNGNPTVSLGLRGIVFIHLWVETANRDIHSGLGGSVFPNAAWRLIWALNSLKDADDNILIDGFYDDVVPASEEDLELLEKLPDLSENWLKTYGLSNFIKGMAGGVELRRAAVFDPTCNIAGLTSGYQGDGGKTIIPKNATAKLDFRLVPNQTPDDILQKLRAHLDTNGFEDVKFKMTGGYPPARVDPGSEYVKMVAISAEEVFGLPSLLEPLVGGSGPMAWFVEQFPDMPIVTAGAGYPGGKVHAPNEHVKIDNLKKAIRHTARIIGRFAES